MTLERPSLVSLLVRPSFRGKPISSATGFVVGRPGDDRRWLVTNWHVVAGRDPSTGHALNTKTGAVPDALIVEYHLEGAYLEGGSLSSRRHSVTEALFDSAGQPLWYEHPAYGQRVDVVALPVTQQPGSVLFHHNPWEPGAPLPVSVSRPLSVIGFPFGNTAGLQLPIWLQAWVASEPDIDFDDLPLFLVDARTRPGQSGSPVIAFAPVGLVAMEGGFGTQRVPSERFVGVYSGRMNDQSDIGRVWKRTAVVETINGAKKGSPLLRPLPHRDNEPDTRPVRRTLPGWTTSDPLRLSYRACRAACLVY